MTNEELHTSLLVHEIVHTAVVDNYRGSGAPGHAASEYVAYVVQLATMQVATRDRVLAAYQDGDFASLSEINDFVHAMQPHQFGVWAYRYFMRGGHAYMLEEILSGRLQTGLVWPE